jgi:hypothetical protein
LNCFFKRILLEERKRYKGPKKTKKAIYTTTGPEHMAKNHRRERDPTAPQTTTLKEQKRSGEKQQTGH